MILRGEFQMIADTRHLSSERARLTGASLPSAGSLGMVPPLPRYYESTPTSCRPSRLTSLPSLGGTAAAPWTSLPPAQGAAPWAWGLVTGLPAAG
jgi:hypothetical protein